MNHAITIGGLLSFFMFLAGIGMCGFGALVIFAAGMSDAPAAGDDAAKHGCIIGAIGIVLIALTLAVWGIA